VAKVGFVDKPQIERQRKEKGSKGLDFEPFVMRKLW
jgi:hypothetical protein